MTSHWPIWTAIAWLAFTLDCPWIGGASAAMGLLSFAAWCFCFGVEVKKSLDK